MHLQNKVFVDFCMELFQKCNGMWYYCESFLNKIALQILLFCFYILNKNYFVFILFMNIFQLKNFERGNTFRKL